MHALLHLSKVDSSVSPTQQPGHQKQCHYHYYLFMPSCEEQNVCGERVLVNPGLPSQSSVSQCQPFLGIMYSPSAHALYPFIKPGPSQPGLSLFSITPSALNCLLSNMGLGLGPGAWGMGDGGLGIGLAAATLP